MKKRNGKFLDLMWIIVSIINIFNNFYMYEIKNNVHYLFINYSSKIFSINNNDSSIGFDVISFLEE